MWTVCSFSTLKTSISLPFDSHSHWEAKFILLESVVRDFWPLFWFLTRTWLGFFITIVCLFLTLLGLPCSVGFPPVAVCGFLVVVASLLRSTGSKAWAQELWCTDFSCPWRRRYPDQGSNLCPLAGRRLLTHCTTNKVSWWYKIFFKNWFFFSDSTTRCPSMDFFFIGLFLQFTLNLGLLYFLSCVESSRTAEEIYHCFFSCYLYTVSLPVQLRL